MIYKSIKDASVSAESMVNEYSTEDESAGGSVAVVLLAAVVFVAGASVTSAVVVVAQASAGTSPLTVEASMVKVPVVLYPQSASVSMMCVLTTTKEMSQASTSPGMVFVKKSIYGPMTLASAA